MDFAAAVAQRVERVHRLVLRNGGGRGGQRRGKFGGGIGAFFGGVPVVGFDFGKVVGTNELRQPHGAGQRAQRGIVGQAGVDQGFGAAAFEFAGFVGAGHHDNRQREPL